MMPLWPGAFDPRPFVPKVKLLTRWQFVCLIGIANGRLHKQIAGEWGKADRTITNHCLKLRRKLGLESSRGTMRVKLTRIAVAAGVVD